MNYTRCGLQVHNYHDGALRPNRGILYAIWIVDDGGLCGQTG